MRFFKKDQTAATQPTILTNTPVWGTLDTRHRAGFSEVWTLKVNHSKNERALWLRFEILSSENGFRRIAEVWAVHSQRKENSEVSKVAVKQTYDVSNFQPTGEGLNSGIRIAECEFNPSRCRGSLQSKGRTIRWDFTINAAKPIQFRAVPEFLGKFNLAHQRSDTIFEDLKISGTIEIDGVKSEWQNASGMQRHIYGARNSQSWVWGHCNSFVNEQGERVPVLFEGLCANMRIAGIVPLPQSCSFYFRYKDTEYRFNSFWNSIHVRSQSSLSEWRFQAEEGEFSFRGHLLAQYRDFAGLTIEDTDGSLLYCANSNLSNMTLLVYRHGKLESALKAKGPASFEIVQRQQNPYVPMIL